MSSKFYITTPIYYINAKPHIGHAYATVSADILARYHRMIGNKTFFLTGTDEHGEKNEEIAINMKMDPQEYADMMGKEFQDTWKKLNISNDNFLRTTDPKHKKAVQNALQQMLDKGHIYKGTHSGLYCKGCEQYLTEKDLVDGLCPDHKKAPEMRNEESYMFKLSAFSDKLKKMIERDEFLITPESKKNEILSFYEQGLNDISFSRNINWGVKLPWDESQTAYVWPDAFLNYLTGLGWDGKPGKAPEMWPADIHLMSKDILRVHATIWAAMLLALDLPLPKRLAIHGFFLVDGQKMSKSIGNVISPVDLMEKYGVDATRYLLADATPFGHDGDIGWEKFDEKYNADLANGLGNLVARSTTLAVNMKEAGIKLKQFQDKTETLKGHKFVHSIEGSWTAYQEVLNDVEIDSALRIANHQIKYLDGYITLTKPWAMIKEKDALVGEIMYNILERIRHTAIMILPFMPETTEKIFEALDYKLEKDFKKSIEWGGLSKKANIKKADILFPRI